MVGLQLINASKRGLGLKYANKRQWVGSSLVQVINVLSLVWHQVTSSNAALSSIETWETKFSEISIKNEPFRQRKYTWVLRKTQARYIKWHIKQRITGKGTT